MSTKHKSLFAELEKKYGRLTFGNLLRSWRLADDESQTDFARKIGISVQNLNDLEMGRRIPRPARVVRIANKLKLAERPLIQLALRDALYAEGLKYNINLKPAG